MHISSNWFSEAVYFWASYRCIEIIGLFACHISFFSTSHIDLVALRWSMISQCYTSNPFNLFKSSFPMWWTAGKQSARCWQHHKNMGRKVEPSRHPFSMASGLERSFLASKLCPVKVWETFFDLDHIFNAEYSLYLFHHEVGQANCAEHISALWSANIDLTSSQCSLLEPIFKFSIFGCCVGCMIVKMS